MGGLSGVSHDQSGHWVITTMTLKCLPSPAPVYHGNACEGVEGESWPVTLSSDECGVAVAIEQVLGIPTATKPRQPWDILFVARNRLCECSLHLRG
jgi:hypothetical protein